MNVFKKIQNFSSIIFYFSQLQRKLQKNGIMFSSETSVFTLHSPYNHMRFRKTYGRYYIPSPKALPSKTIEWTSSIKATVENVLLAEMPISFIDVLQFKNLGYEARITFDEEN